MVLIAVCYVVLQVFAELPSLSFVRCASLIGHNNSHEMRTSQMQDTIAKFRDGRVCLNAILADLVSSKAVVLC